MASLVEELQRDALDSSVPVGDLLRKAYTVSKKLDLTEFEKWVSLEMNGYPDACELPDYRLVNGNLRANNTVLGKWIPCQFVSPEEQETFSTFRLAQATGELEEMIRGVEQAPIIFDPSPSAKAALIETMEVPMEPGIFVDKSQIHAILDRVRNMILEWSLDLEKQRILGDGLTFSQEEKQAATNITFNIENMSNSQIQQGTEELTQTLNITNADLDQVRAFLQALKQSVDELGLQEIQRAQLDTDIQTIEPQLSAPEPKNSIIQESLQSIRNILEGITSSTIASELLSRLAPLLTSLLGKSHFSCQIP